MKVTRIAFSAELNAGKYARLEEQAERLGRVRAEVWRRYGSVAGAALSGRQVRDRWLADGYHAGFGVLANAWKETVRDAMGDIRASREAAKAEARRAVSRRAGTDAERKRLFTALKADAWAGDPYLSRMMRKHWRRGCSKVANQIIVRADKVRTFTLTDGGNVWLAIPGLLPRETVKIPLDTTAAPSGTLRVILRDGRAEVHYQVDGEILRDDPRGLVSDRVSGRRGSALVLVNAAYTSQADPRTGALGVRRGDRLHCPGGDVYQADHAAAINILQRDGDPDITLFTPHTRVRQILRERADRQRARLPAQDSSPAARGGERIIQ